MELSKRNSIISHPIEIQYFPFFPNFMKYILQNSSPKLLLKLYQCCKYFYFKSKITIAPNVWFDHKEKEIEFKFFVDNGKNFFYRAYPNIEKLWLCDMLRIYSISDTILIGNVFFNKIYRNNLKELSITTLFTSFKELEILSKSPNLTEIELLTCVKNENGQPIPIEEIMVLFPNMKTFKISPTHFTLESFEKLLKFKFLSKINSMGFWMVKTEFDPISMCKFLRETFEDDAEFLITFGFDSHHLRQQFLPRVKEIINGWETKKLKRTFFC
uniref:F-box domain-containing protein n=1 Tax=Panagrolaimus davidi TaxID=227884 RepID=A0A914NZY7_9BILA